MQAKLFRTMDPPKEIEEEGERLLEKWAEDDEGLSWWDYLAKYASPEAIAFMNEINEGVYKKSEK